MGGSAATCSRTAPRPRGRIQPKKEAKAARPRGVGTPAGDATETVHVRGARRVTLPKATPQEILGVLRAALALRASEVRALSPPPPPAARTGWGKDPGEVAPSLSCGALLRQRTQAIGFVFLDYQNLRVEIRQITLEVFAGRCKVETWSRVLTSPVPKGCSDSVPSV